MWANDPHTREALETLGLEPGSSLADAKSAFRQLAKSLHPDQTPATENTLSRLASAVQAIRHLEKQVPQFVDWPLTRDEASKGLTRTLAVNGRNLLFKCPPRASNGDLIPAIGEPRISARIQLADEPVRAGTPAASGLSAFINEFATGEPAARFARWLRKARSAA